MKRTLESPVLTLANYFTGTYKSECREHEGRLWSDWLVLWDDTYIPITDWTHVRVTVTSKSKTKARTHYIYNRRR